MIYLFRGLHVGSVSLHLAPSLSLHLSLAVPLILVPHITNSSYANVAFCALDARRILFSYRHYYVTNA